MSDDVITVYGQNLVDDVIGQWSFAELTYAALTDGKRPSAGQARMIEALLTTFVDHGVTPSSLVTRLTLLGAPESLQAAIAAGLCGAGSRYLGTMQAAGEMLGEALGAQTLERPPALVGDEVVARHRQLNRQIPGLGHPEHKQGDPRTPKLVELARQNDCYGAHCELLFAIAAAFTKANARALPVNAAGLAGAIVCDMGLPPVAGRGLAIISRAAGLVGIALREIEQPSAQGIWDDLR